MNGSVKQELEENIIKSTDLNDIIAHIESLKDTCIIESREIGFRDRIRKWKDPNYPVDLSIKKTENGISIPFVIDGFLDLIKGHIQTSVTTIGFPTVGIETFDFSKYPNISKFIGTSGLIRPSDFEKIVSTSNIKDVESNFAASSFGELQLNGIAYDESLCVCKDVVMHDKATNSDPFYEFRKKINTSKVNIAIDGFDRDTLDRLMHNFDIIANGANIKTPYGQVELKPVGNKIQIIARLDDLTHVENFYHCIEGIYDIDSLVIVLDSEIQSANVEYDFSNLDRIAGYEKVFVNYYRGAPEQNESYIDYRSLIECIKYYRELISKSSLSPLEKLMFAYDFIKSFPYKESDENKKDSRNPIDIVKTGNIVCVGYAAMLDEILYELDDNIKIGDFSVDCYEEDDKTHRGGHRRSIVSIDDDKYDIHGIFALDATWDSVFDKGKEVFGDDYDGLSTYEFFLIPFTEYKKVFPHDTLPNIFTGSLSELNTDMSSDNLHEQLGELREARGATQVASSKFVSTGIPKSQVFTGSFPETITEGKSAEEIVKRFDTPRISFETFIEAIRSTRLAEGYTGEFLETEVNKIARINSRFYGVEIPNMQIGRPMSAEEDESRKR